MKRNFSLLHAWNNKKFAFESKNKNIFQQLCFGKNHEKVLCSNQTQRKRGSYGEFPDRCVPDGWMQGQESPEEIFSGKAGAREWKCREREGACKRIKCSAANPVTDENIDFQRSIVSLSKCKSEHLY